ncbi:MAG TPA: NADH-quinone oxidoreductase subunit K [Pseudolabrys sp.]|nr:NADH-quinone oxidoreductase subunit K [Pseudolabrys sp.]
MEPAFALAFGVLVAVAAYLILSRNVLRVVLGLLVLSNAANLSLFVAGRMENATPPLVAAGEAAIGVSANPLPQALILTAIVISFSLAAFTIALFEAAHRRLNTVDSDRMRIAEPIAGISEGPATGARRAKEPVQ